MIAFRVYVYSYEGEYPLRVFTDRDAAISFARDEARRTSEPFGGAIGCGVGVEELNLTTEECSDLDGWKDWTTKVVGARFVVDSDVRP